MRLIPTLTLRNLTNVCGKSATCTKLTREMTVEVFLYKCVADEIIELIFFKKKLRL